MGSGIMAQNINDKIFFPSDLKSVALVKNPLAVFGKPIAHSQSPKMQNAALHWISERNPEFENWRYYKFEVAPEQLNDVLPEFHQAGFRGINLTIPHKQVIFDCAKKSEIKFDKFSEMAGACNTLIRTESGWLGTNTDGFGLAKAIFQFSGRVFKDSDVVIFGAGGAARAAAFKAALEGARSIAISNRSQSRLGELIAALKLSNLDAQALSDASQIKASSIVINATSLGLKPSDLPILDFSKLAKDCVFFDMPYVSGGETSSVNAARKAGFKACSGLPMLAWQGALSLNFWTGADIETIGGVMLKALLD